MLSLWLIFELGLEQADKDKRRLFLVKHPQIKWNTISLFVVDDGIVEERESNFVAGSRYDGVVFSFAAVLEEDPFAFHLLHTPLSMDLTVADFVEQLRVKRRVATGYRLGWFLKAVVSIPADLKAEAKLLNWLRLQSIP